MNSQIFYTRKNVAAGQSSLVWNPSPAMQWLSALILVAAVILFPERPAWGQEPALLAASDTHSKTPHTVLVKMAQFSSVVYAPAREGDMKMPRSRRPNSVIANTITGQALRYNQIKLSHAGLGGMDAPRTINPCSIEGTYQFESQHEIQLSALAVAYTIHRLP